MSIQGIFFDLYGTLLVYGNMKQAWSDWLTTFYGLLQQRGLNVPQDSFALECDGFFSGIEPAAGGENNLTALERRIKALGTRTGLELDPKELRHIADTIADIWQTHITIDPETIPVLTALKQDKIIGLVSNFDHPPHLRRILSAHGIEGFFDTVIISSDVGVKKPDPAILSFALAQTGLLQNQVVYVGDTKEDVSGALAAGIRPIFIARPVNGTDSDALDFQIADPGKDFAKDISAKNEVTVINRLPELLTITKR